MSFLAKLERSLGRFAVPNLSLYLVLGQVIVYLGIILGKLAPGWLAGRVLGSNCRHRRDDRHVRIGARVPEHR